MFHPFRLDPIPLPKPRRTTAVLAPALWAAQSLNFLPDPHQSSVLDSTHTRVLVNCCRQWGKSTTAALRALHHALHHPRSETILIAPTLRQSAELLRKITGFHPSLPGDGVNRHSLQFPNGSRIVALPGRRDSIRGFSRISLLIIDEAAWVPDALYYAVRPFLAASPKASLLILSTPNGESGFFHRAWVSPQPWLRITVPATECSRISESFLAEERAAMPEATFRQEYLCEFLAPHRSVFTNEMIDRFLSETNFGPLPGIDFDPES